MLTYGSLFLNIGAYNCILVLPQEGSYIWEIRGTFSTFQCIILNVLPLLISQELLMYAATLVPPREMLTK